MVEPLEALELEALGLGDVVLAMAGIAAAQESPAVAILTIDQERLFLESEFGEALMAVVEQRPRWGF